MNHRKLTELGPEQHDRPDGRYSNPTNRESSGTFKMEAPNRSRQLPLPEQQPRHGRLGH